MSGGVVGMILWNSVEATRNEPVGVAWGFCEAMCECECRNEKVSSSGVAMDVEELMFVEVGGSSPGW
jgi:hypothetical protein